MFSAPRLGHGIGLRTEHYETVLSEHPSVDWFEVISENFMVPGGNPRAVLREVREHYPVVLHGVSMSLGSSDPLNLDYLRQLKELAAEVQPAIVSDHLCWSSFGGKHAHDLLPLPYTEEALAHLVERVSRVQDALGRQIIVENVSSYVAYRHSTMSEWEFLAALCERADCGLLLDVNNIFVSAHNHRFDAKAFIDGIPVGRVGQMHLAGHSVNGELLLDTHDHPVRDEVWELYAHAVARFGLVPSLVEWDDLLPAFSVVQAESDKAKAIADRVLGARR